MRALGIRLIFTLVLLLVLALLFAASMAAPRTPTAGRPTHETAAPAAVPAAPAPVVRPAEASPAASESFLGAGGKLLIASLILAGLLYAATRLMRRLPIARFLPNGDGPVRVVARTHLGAKESLLLVDVGATSLLLGVTAQGIHTLHVWPDGRGSSAAPVTGPSAPRAATPLTVPGQLRTLDTRLFGTRR